MLVQRDNIFLTTDKLIKDIESFKSSLDIDKDSLDIALIDAPETSLQYKKISKAYKAFLSKKRLFEMCSEGLFKDDEYQEFATGVTEKQKDLLYKAIGEVRKFAETYVDTAKVILGGENEELHIFVQIVARDAEEKGESIAKYLRSRRYKGQILRRLRKDIRIIEEQLNNIEKPKEEDNWDKQVYVIDKETNLRESLVSANKLFSSVVKNGFMKSMCPRLSCIEHQAGLKSKKECLSNGEKLYRSRMRKIFSELPPDIHTEVLKLLSKEEVDVKTLIKNCQNYIESSEYALSGAEKELRAKCEPILLDLDDTCFADTADIISSRLREEANNTTFEERYFYENLRTMLKNDEASIARYKGKISSVSWLISYLRNPNDYRNNEWYAKEYSLSLKKKSIRR